MESHTIRVYRNDNAHTDLEYVTVVDNQTCYATELVQATLPEWKHAIVHLVREIDAPDPALLDGTATALGGWHYLLNESDFDEIPQKPGLTEDEGGNLYLETVVGERTLISTAEEAAAAREKAAANVAFIKEMDEEE